MGETVTLDRVRDLSAPDRDALRALSVVVYPPGQLTDSPGRRIEWSEAEWCVRIHGDNGALVSYVGRLGTRRAARRAPARTALVNRRASTAAGGARRSR